MSATVLTRHGLGLADDLVRAAQMEGLDLAIAATVIEKESGGRNVWGSDGVSTGGTYTKGGPVTQSNYVAYRTAMKAGKIGRQGVGPAQCTSAEYQDRADQLGGCWLPLANMRSGFRGLKALTDRYGLQQGARRYNGSGAAAERYGADFVARHRVWVQRLGGTGASSGAAPAGGPAFRLDEGDVGPAVHALASWFNRWYPAYSKIDLDPVPAKQRYGPQTRAVVREFAHRSGIPEADGKNVGPKIAAALAAAGFAP